MKILTDNKVFFNVVVSIVVVAILAIFFIAIYDSFTGSQLRKDSLLGNPEIVAVIIGLIISILFVERWKSLESRVQKLSEGPVETMNGIQTFAKQEIEQKFKEVEAKAESLKATVSSLVEKHPWLEVITDREIIVETDSIRAILRTCYSLFRDDKVLHLFEYLEHCSKKGTTLDPKDRYSKLKGTADDFHELSFFCEAYMGDYYLSTIFLKRYLEQYPDSLQILTPLYLRKLLRIGDLKAVSDISKFLRHKIYGSNLYNRLRILLRIDHPVSERHKWDAINSLLLTETALCEFKRIDRYKRDIKKNKYTEVFKSQQHLYDIEYSILEGSFERATSMLDSIDTEDADPLILNELSYLYARVGNYENATKLRDILNSRAKKFYGEAYDYKKPRIINNSNRSKSSGKKKISSKKTVSAQVDRGTSSIIKKEIEKGKDSNISPKNIGDQKDDISRE